MVDNRGAAYNPSAPPQSGGEAEIRVWAAAEFGRIATAIRQGRSQFLSLDALDTLPEKPFEGMLGFFVAGIAGTGAGLYEYRGGAWNKL